MKKKGLLLFLIAFLSLSAVLYVTVGLFGFGRQYIDKNNKITAAVTDLNTVFSPQDSKEIFDVKIGEVIDYFADNDINTAIIPFNEGMFSVGDIGAFSCTFSDAEFTDKSDILKTIKKPLEKAKIQIILEIDCSQLTTEQLQQTVTEINKKYAFAGVLLKNYTQDYSFLQTLKMSINSYWKNYYFGIRLDNMETAQQIQGFGAVDFYIFDDISETEYRNAKKGDFAGETILLDYSSPNFLSELFVLGNFSGYDGVVLCEYTTPSADLSLYHSIMDTSVQLQKFDFSINNVFNIIYPSKNIDTYYKTIFITGTANPAQPVFVNGNEVVPAQDGTFGCYIELSEGENLIEVQQADNYISRIVNKKSYSYTGSSTASKKKSDDTQKAKKGQIVQTTGALTSVLVVPDDDSRIIDGVQQGVQMVVQKSVKTERDGKYTWAYQLSNGAYVLAKNVEWVDKDEYIKSTLGDIHIEKLENGDEYLNLRMTGKPAIVSYFDESKVVFEIMDTQLSGEFYDETEQQYTVLLDSVFADNCNIETTDGNVYITIENTGSELWGYNTEYYDNNTVKIYLKNAPHKSSGAQPLKNITVVLDAGHGGTDPGALPLGGVDGPGEHEINLAIAQATKICLEKLGATVHLTRTDDTYLTLQQRRDITNTIKPDLFISMHHNSLEYTVDGTKSYGFESYYFSPQSKAVAERMAYRISQTAERKNRGYYFGYYYVLRNDIAPCVLNEYGFINNPYEFSALYRDESIYKAAMGTALAVVDIIPE